MTPPAITPPPASLRGWGFHLSMADRAQAAGAVLELAHELGAPRTWLAYYGSLKLGDALQRLEALGWQLHKAPPGSQAPRRDTKGGSGGD